MRLCDSCRNRKIKEKSIFFRLQNSNFWKRKFTAPKWARKIVVLIMKKNNVDFYKISIFF